MWRNVVQVAVSYPVWVLAAGYVLGAATAVLTALAFWFEVDSIALLASIFFIAGLYVTVQEALESTVTADMVQPDTLGTVNGAAKFISSATVGVVWTTVSPVLGFGLAAALMLAGTVALQRLDKD